MSRAGGIRKGAVAVVGTRRFPQWETPAITAEWKIVLPVSATFDSTAIKYFADLGVPWFVRCAWGRKVIRRPVLRPFLGLATHWHDGADGRPRWNPILRGSSGVIKHPARGEAVRQLHFEIIIKRTGYDGVDRDSLRQVLVYNRKVADVAHEAGAPETPDRLTKRAQRLREKIHEQWPDDYRLPAIEDGTEERFQRYQFSRGSWCKANDPTQFDNSEDGDGR